MKEKQTRVKILSAVYGIYQINLKEHDLLNRSGAPKKRRDISIYTHDIIDVYKWLSEQLKDQSEYQLNGYAEQFNEHARKLHDDYLLNMTLLGTHLLAQLIDDSTKAEQIMIGTKLERIARHFSFYVERDIYRESRIAANNLYRIYTGKAELTIDTRKKNADRWKEAKRKSKRYREESDRTGFS